MIVRRATIDADLEHILAWRRERRAWLAPQGESQWAVPLPRHAVAATISAGQTWMVDDGAAPVATITLTAYPDLQNLWDPENDPQPIWYPQDRPDQALYASKIIVPLRCAGQGLGAELLDWAGGRAFQAGLIWLRLDTWTTTTRLHDYYRRQRFRLVRRIPSSLPDVTGAAFERAAQPYTGSFKTDGD